MLDISPGCCVLYWNAKLDSPVLYWRNVLPCEGFLFKPETYFSDPGSTLDVVHPIPDRNASFLLLSNRFWASQEQNPALLGWKNWDVPKWGFLTDEWKSREPKGLSLSKEKHTNQQAKIPLCKWVRLSKVVKQLCAVGLSSAPAYPWIYIWLSQQGPTGHSETLGSAFGRCCTKSILKLVLDFLWETHSVGQLLREDLPATPEYFFPPCIRTLPLHWAWLGCSYLPCHVVGCSQHSCWGHAAATNVLSLAVWKATNTVWLPAQESFSLPLGWGTLAQAAISKTMVGDTASYPSEGPVGKKMRAMTKLFRLHLLNHKVPLQTYQRDAKESCIIFVVSHLHEGSCWKWPSFTRQNKLWGRIDFYPLWLLSGNN